MTRDAGSRIAVGRARAGRRHRPSSWACPPAARRGAWTPTAARSTGCAWRRLDGGPVRTSAGFTVLPEHDARCWRPAGTVVVPGVQAARAMTDGTLPRRASARCAAATARRADGVDLHRRLRARRGRPARRPPGHHALDAHRRFARALPQVAARPDVLFVDDGDVLTSAGNAAGIDLLLHLIRRDHGTEVANRVARRNVVAPWRDGGQSQFVERPRAPTATPDRRRPARGPWPAGRTAHARRPGRHARMSVRTFTRRFREETGCRPRAGWPQQRVALARRLLEATDLPVERVAAEAGFGTTASLRQHLRAAIGVAPLTYRRTFRGPVAHHVTGRLPARSATPRGRASG